MQGRATLRSERSVNDWDEEEALPRGDRFGDPSDLSYFGDAVARKANKVTSLAAALNAPGPHLSVIPLDDAPSISGGATSPPLSDVARMFQGVIADKPAKAT